MRADKKDTHVYYWCWTNTERCLFNIFGCVYLPHVVSIYPNTWSVLTFLFLIYFSFLGGRFEKRLTWFHFIPFFSLKKWPILAYDSAKMKKKSAKDLKINILRKNLTRNKKFTSGPSLNLQLNSFSWAAKL